MLGPRSSSERVFIGNTCTPFPPSRVCVWRAATARGKMKRCPPHRLSLSQRDWSDSQGQHRPEVLQSKHNLVRSLFCSCIWNSKATNLEHVAHSLYQFGTESGTESNNWLRWRWCGLIRKADFSLSVSEPVIKYLDSGLHTL